MNPRVLVAHRKALQDGIGAFAAACQAAGGWDQTAADVLLAAILGADDSKTRYVVGTRYPTGSVEIYGPYATADAATKAIELGVCAHHEDAQVGIWPLIPAPSARGSAPSRRRGQKT